MDKEATIGRQISNTFFCGSDEQNRSVADRDNVLRDYFITITSDGILKSDNHLM